MSNIEELNKRIANANALSEKLNRERAVNLGKRDTLKEQLETAIKGYNNTYNRNLSIENIESEIKEISDAKEKELSHLESILNAISSGNYELANQLAGVSGESPATVDNSIENSAVADNNTVASNKARVLSEPDIKTSEPSLSGLNMPEPPSLSGLDIPSEPVSPSEPIGLSMPAGVSEPSEPIGLSMPSEISEPISNPISEPAGLSMPEPSDDTPTPSAPSPTSFSAILGGTAFTL